jgi:hypothetical protein
MTKVTLSAKATVDGKKLTVACLLTNETAKKIYLFTDLWVVKDGKIVPDSHPAYVSIDEKRILHLGKIIHPLPKEKFVEQRYVPFARPIAAGGKWEGKLEFELPVQEFNPYYVNDDNAQWDEVTIVAVQVCVDWMEEVEGLKPHPTAIDGAFRLEHGQLLKLIQRTSTGDLPLKAAALRRADSFERFTCRS